MHPPLQQKNKFFYKNHTPKTHRKEVIIMAKQERQQAVDFIRSHPEQYLELAKDKKSYICPICNSGTGQNGTGITSKDNIHFTCWAGCYKNSDIIDIIGLQYSLTEFTDKLNKAAELYGIDIKKLNNASWTWEEATLGRTPRAAANSSKDSTAPSSDFFKRANSNLDKTDYYSQRGISRATADKFKLGYIEKWRHPKAPTKPASPRLIIPTGKESYIARDTRADAEIPAEQRKYTKSKVGQVNIFNLETLRTAAEPIFITEGEIDAISIYEAGGAAVALGGVSNINKLAEAVKEAKPKQPLILALDNDSPGKEASRKLYTLLQDAELKAAGVRACNLTAPLYDKYKDANEYLQADREGLTMAVASAKEIAEQPELATRLQYETDSQASSYLETMRAELEAEYSEPELSTGFKNLDQIINGGLYPGLYFIGAVSSLGKTTFALQIADSIAKQGQDCLIISLEMAKRELIAKSLSRITAEYSARVNGNIKSLAHTTADILNLKRQQGYYNEAGIWQEYTENKKAEIAASIDLAYSTYSDYADHIFIYEGIGDITPEAIKDRIKEHIAIYGRTPAVIVDYLQILQGENSRDTDKTKTDKNVTNLKRLSRDYKTPVIAISSVNRTSYNEPISMESFKESGGIEFSSDILIGLQYEGYDYDYINKESDKDRLKRLAELKADNREKAKNGEPQTIELKILKNRNGNRGTVRLEFYPMYNYFKEIPPKPQQKERRG